MPADRTTTDYEALTDEELWASTLGHRLRRYADRLLAAESERIGVVDQRQLAGHQRIGIGYARDILSPDGSLESRNDGDDGDPWAYWQSPAITGLRDAIKGTDGTRDAAQEVAKAYIASLQDAEHPVADEFPPEQYDMPVGPPWSGDEEAPADDGEEATPLDVAGALSYLLTGRALSDSGPFAVHDADGFHDEPYVLLSVDSMRRVLDRLPQSTW